MTITITKDSVRSCVAAAGLSLLLVAPGASASLIEYEQSLDDIRGIPFADEAFDDAVSRRKKRRRKDLPCHTLGATRTFFRINETQASWGLTQWRSMFNSVAALGFTEVILESTSTPEYSVYDETSVAPDADFDSPLEAMVMAARERGIRVWAGLHDSGLAQPAQDASADAWDEYYERRLDDQVEEMYSLTLALLSVDPNGEIFRGWYVADAIETDALLDSRIADPYERYLTQLRRKLERVQPAWPVMVSGKASRSVSAKTTAQRWASVLDESRIDVFLFHDGIGDGRLSLEELRQWLPALGAILETPWRSLGVVVELNSATGAIPTDHTTDPSVGVQAGPAPFSRVIAQLKAARFHGSEPMTVLSVSEYVGKDADVAQKRMYRRWWIDQRGCRGTPRRLAMR